MTAVDWIHVLCYDYLKRDYKVSKWYKDIFMR